jgi:hypothetical protein
MSDDELDAWVWGAEKIAPLFNLPIASFYHLAAGKKLPVRKVGKQLVTTKRIARDYLRHNRAAAQPAE